MVFLGRGLAKVIVATLLGATLWLAAVFGSSNPAWAACAYAGSGGCPIRIHFRSNSNQITLREQLTPRKRSYSYAFRARAGQKLSWTLEGPTVRTTIQYPNGGSDGPGLPSEIGLSRTGRYVFTISSNPMAEGIYGPFHLMLRIR
jgi:hypothetical protein